MCGDYAVQYRGRGLCPAHQDVADNHINPVIISAYLIVAPRHAALCLPWSGIFIVAVRMYGFTGEQAAIVKGFEILLDKDSVNM